MTPSLQQPNPTPNLPHRHLGSQPSPLRPLLRHQIKICTVHPDPPKLLTRAPQQLLHSLCHVRLQIPMVLRRVPPRDVLDILAHTRREDGEKIRRPWAIGRVVGYPCDGIRHRAADFGFDLRGGVGEEDP